MAHDERVILEALRERQAEACGRFVDAHYADVFRFFGWLTRDPEASADLTQESFAAFWASLERLDAASDTDLKSWLYGIARNRWRKWCRDRRVPCVPLDNLEARADDAPGPEALALVAGERGRVARALLELPAEFREAFVLRVFQELSYRQIARGIEISEELARWRVHRARRLLRATLMTEGGEERSDGTDSG